LFFREPLGLGQLRQREALDFTRQGESQQSGEFLRRPVSITLGKASASATGVQEKGRVPIRMI
jgi:hypothetical protein